MRKVGFEYTNDKEGASSLKVCKYMKNAIEARSDNANMARLSLHGRHVKSFSPCAHLNMCGYKSDLPGLLCVFQLIYTSFVPISQ